LPLCHQSLPEKRLLKIHCTSHLLFLKSIFVELDNRGLVALGVTGQSLYARIVIGVQPEKLIQAFMREWNGTSPPRL
jgi:hypothetical protein